MSQSTVSREPIAAAYAGVALAVAAVSTSAVLVRLATAPAPVIATYRLAFAVALMAPVVLGWHRQALRRVSPRDLGLCLIAGVFLAFHFVAWFESLALTTVASSTVLVTLQPLFAFVGTWLLFGERLPLPALLGGVLAIMGSGIIGWGDLRIAGEAFTGDALALFAAMLISAYFMVGQSVRQRLDLMPYTFLVYGMATAVLLVYDLAQGHALGGYPTADWVIFLAMAVGPTLLGHSILNWSVKWVGASVIAVAILFEPVGASALAYAVLGEVPVATQYAGGAVILLGIGIFMHFRVGRGRTR
ncbi:Threonine/homoserine efflux transporter RhtA [Limimonas halophila]|uniref:Threonine/homoserine efflux transporter RhtA n=1 Tax=Limimonas halophila TaxID=1082479 RepID=A0A1G7M7C0_9PROT|nr:DMT family transporter [Limimonas halophila]SDF57611.1 Threonine/homoserine efflux transporter RhtA [Limimonas halophila]